MHPVKAAIKGIANTFGFNIVSVQQSLRKMYPNYEPVYPLATYSPWNTDKAFDAAYLKIKHATLVDKYRCFELWRLVEQAAKLESGAIIEIGVWRGGTVALLGTQAKNCNINDKVFACDTFTGVVKAGAQDQSYVGGEHADTSLSSVENLLSKTMGLDNVEILEGIFPDDTGKAVEHLQFRLCHIDVDVYESARDVVDWIWKRMVPGGIIVYDDYGFSTCSGIARQVDEQMLLDDRLVIHNLNGHAIIIKR
jgi:O-methyltransferase